MRVPEQVPVLRGWAWRIFVCVWALVLLAALSSTCLAFNALQPWKSSWPARVNSGLVYAPHLPPGQPEVLLVIGNEARLAGIERGDILLSVNGRDTRGLTQNELDDEFAGLDRSAFTITTLSSQGERKVSRLTRDARRYPEALASAGLTHGAFVTLNILFNYGIGSLLPLLAGVILLVARPRDPLAPWVSLGMVLLPLGNGPPSFWLLGLGGAFTSIAMTASAAGGALLVTTLALFPDGRLHSRISRIVIPILAVVVAALDVAPTGFLLGNAVFLVCMIIAVAITFQRYRTLPQSAGRQQIRWALLGFGGSCAALVALMVAQAIRLQPPSFAWLAWNLIASWLFVALLWLLVFGGMTLSLMRYRLYDADAAISRSVVLGALTLCLLAIFAGSEKLIEVLGEEYFGESMGALAGGLGAAIAAVLITPLHHRFSRWAEQRFQSSLVGLRHRLPILVGDMRENADPNALSATILSRIEKGVRAARGAIVYGDAVIEARNIDQEAVRDWLAGWAGPTLEDTPLDVDGADRLFPLRVPLRADGVAELGWLLLGPRPDGSVYGRDEREVLAEIADPVARGLSVARQRTGREAAARTEMGKLAQTVLNLEQRLSSLEASQGLVAN